MTAEDRQAARDARRAAREAETPADRCGKLVKRLNERTGIEHTFGYLGNCDHTYDDRYWYVFIPHPGRVGTADDRFGGYSTKNLDRMVDYLRGILRGLEMSR